eukprot:CAMPEP_0203844830 /NCGR_PEP_ID=MMETSP0359-20131031/3449_1 /ASSEMBLY_ACC=CAM_ASM_000338 /TAXON_ID=268821 /ORGANISM="Scrippsiella Hangoei, Strain SHTV-5" /LENGTH=1196 /DNA_ID=CAMNT_0050759865 /DNA_START=11 /DNA_END=3601 /DNA_ORIENTATION=+
MTWCWLLAAIFAAAAANGELGDGAANAKGGHSAHRVIVRYAGASAAARAGGAEKLQARAGVVKAQTLPQVGMAVVSMVSAEAGEQLIEDLQLDAEVELAVLDTWVHAFDFLPASTSVRTDVQEALSRALRSEGKQKAQCSAHPACHMRGLVGDCCPSVDGTMLSCCSAAGPDLVQLKTPHGTHLAATQAGALFQASGPLQDDGKFSVMANDDGTISFKSKFGKFLNADEQGKVRADRAEALGWERFELGRGLNGTISLASRFHKFLTFEKGGLLVARSENANESFVFEMFEVEGPGQHFANDPAFPNLWGMHHWAGFDIDAPEAWKVWTGEVGKGITVAVIDTGIDYNHEDLREQMWVNPLEIPGNGIDDDQNGIVDDIHGADFANQDGDPMDDMMHGTHCAGTIAGVGNNRQGVTGVAWRGVRLMALKFLDSKGAGRISDAIQAIDYAVAQGAKIASNSWGGGGSNPALRMAIEHAEAAGMLFTAAAGNEANDNDLTPSYPANVDCANVISVASTTWLGALSTFSNTGMNTVHVAAPGSDIYSTVPGGGYRRLSGTSMAAPHVTGMAALVWMYRPQLSMHQVKDIVLGSVRKLSSLEGKISTGGLINAKNALEAAWAFAPPQPPAHAPLALAFEDVDPNIAVYGGTVTVTAAADESDIEYYRIYFVSGAGFQLQGLGEPIPATGASEYTLKVNGSFVPSTYARYLVAVSGRAIGELPAQLQGSAPRVALKDYGRPISGARALRWTGDADRRLGFIQGSLVFDRALNEASVTNYNVYWRMADGCRGPMLGSIDGAGFREPACTGRTCPFINGSRTAAGGFRFERGAYAESEEAMISTFGPGRVNVLRFDTEEVYDSLKIGSEEVSGNLSGSVPFVKEFPEGPLNIAWKSDESMQGGGWSIEIFDASPSVEFKINTTALLGSGFEVVAAYGQNELQSHVAFVRVTDNAPGHASEPMAAVVPTTGRGLAASSSNGGGAAEPAKATAPSKQGKDRWHTGQGESEPWLPRRETTGNYGRVHWSESVFRRERGSVVRSSFVVQGLAPEVASQPATRAELVRAFATSQTWKDASVRLVSIAAVGDSEAVEGSVAAKIVFELEGPSGASTAASDRVESALISLAAGGRATSRFDAALGAALAPSPADGAALASASAALSCRFGASQPLSAMMLAAEAELLAATQATPAPEGRKLRGAVPYVYA